MTESEWLTIVDNPGDMQDVLDWTRQRERKIRLLLCALCRQVWHLLSEPSCRDALEAGEKYADGEGSEIELIKAFIKAMEEYRCIQNDTWPGIAFRAGGNWSALATAFEFRTCSDLQKEPAKHCHFLRDIFGNPFRPVAIEPAWLTTTVTGLATAAYEKRTLPSGELDPARLAVLADAVEETGCGNLDILNHLRGPGPHVRGCWVLDLLLGKK